MKHSNSETLKKAFIPELGNLKSGKVRDIYEFRKNLLLIASDRLSCFDHILKEQIKDKGKILTQLALYWFEQTKDIIQNHILFAPDPNITIVKKCNPILIEVIVRAYLTGSIWRDYAKGKREKGGIKLEENLEENQKLPFLIITPTTKNQEGHDLDISKEEIIEKEIISKEIWEKIEQVSLALFKRGQEILDKKGLILVDTKYEFGLDEDKNLILIDEIHTPDSSRFWYKEDYEKGMIKQMDKELVRGWLRQQGFEGNGTIPRLTKKIQEEASRRYYKIYEITTGNKLESDDLTIKQRLINNLKKQNLIKGYFVLIIVGSKKDQDFVNKIKEKLKEKEIPFEIFIGSAHKKPKLILEIIKKYNESIEPLVCITVAGKSNALSGIVAANLKWPVISCPPFKDYQDYLINIHSSLQMPSKVPVLTILNPENAVLAASKILQIKEG